MPLRSIIGLKLGANVLYQLSLISLSFRARLLAIVVPTTLLKEQASTQLCKGPMPFFICDFGTHLRRSELFIAIERVTEPPNDLKRSVHCGDVR